MAINQHLRPVGCAPHTVVGTAWATITLGTSCSSYITAIICLTVLSTSPAAERTVDRFGLFEASFQATGQYANPYTDLKASAVIQRPDGTERTLGLFWDGTNVWKLRISPDLVGKWRFRVRSRDDGLNGKTGQFTCVQSERKGSIQPMPGFPHHFVYQDGSPFLFWGDTAWALYQDEASERLNRKAVFHYIDERADQGISVMHSMLLQEAGWGNSGGDPFESMATQTLNPAYWQEVDARLRYLNNKGIIAGLVLAWGDKRKKEPFAWRLFPGLEARKRYARYIASRYGAYDVYFIVSGEWHAEIRTRPNVTEEDIRTEFIEIGNALHEADMHRRMVGIHPMTQEGSVREFSRAEWMSFSDYQQNYRKLHTRILESHPHAGPTVNLEYGYFPRGPVVNSEYGYFLRDSNFDGHVDKNNSMTADTMRHATWDIIMAGGYPVTGYGTTYMGGNRDKGPFNVDDQRNDIWERQYHVAQRFLSQLEWWRLQPHDEWIRCDTPRSADRNVRVGSRQLLCPPETTYWLLAEPGKNYIAYVRGLKDKVSIELGPGSTGLKATLLDPRTGQNMPTHGKILETWCEWSPPDKRDWVLHLSR